MQKNKTTKSVQSTDAPEGVQKAEAFLWAVVNSAKGLDAAPWLFATPLFLSTPYRDAVLKSKVLSPP